MPGNVANASVGSPVRIMPDHLSRSFTEAREYIGNGNDLNDGTSIRRALTTNSRKYFDREVAIGSVEAAALKVFYEANRHRAFYFYFFAEGTYDATGVSATGRYIVRFDGGFDRVREMGRHAIRIRLAEIL